MAYETKEMTGSIFNNKKKEKDTHPDRQGSCKIDGKEYWISGWVKKDKDGNPWMSLAFKEKTAVTRGRDPTPPRQSAREDMDDEIPF